MVTYLCQEEIAEKVFVTDSIPVPKEKMFKKLEVLSIAEEITKYLED